MNPEGFPQKPQDFLKRKPEVARPGNKTELSSLTAAEFKKAYERLSGEEDLPKKLALLEGWETVSMRGIGWSKNMAELAAVEEDASIDGKVVIKDIEEEIMKKKISFIDQCGTLEDLEKLSIDYKKSDPEIKKAYFDKLHEFIDKCSTLEGLKKFSYLVDHKKTDVDPEIKKAYFNKWYVIIPEEFKRAKQAMEDDYVLEAIKMLTNISEESPDTEDTMTFNMLNPGKKRIEHIDFKKMVADELLEIYGIYVEKRAVAEKELYELEKHPTSEEGRYHRVQAEMKKIKDVFAQLKKVMPGITE